MNYNIKKILWILPALSIYAYLCYQFDFTQDDAYISYRYVANYLAGHGLVYNIGERIEGFTNFGWVLYQIFWGTLGAPYILISKLTGLLFGAGIIIITYVSSGYIFSERDEIFRWFAVYFVAINQSLAYWSPAGLETAAFAFMAISSLWLYIRRSHLLIFTLTIGVLLRPEGALVAAILIVIEAIESKRLPLYTSRCAGIALLFLLPFVFFKLAYYGSILPNPFYAKTSLSIVRFTDGLEYAGRFLIHYGLYGLGLLVPLVFYRKLPPAATAVWTYFAIYIVYVIAVGGDVLKAHRFFLPLIGASALLLSLLLWLTIRVSRRKLRTAISVTAALAIMAATFFLPRSYVLQYNRLEKQLTGKMKYMAEQMAMSDPSDFSVALSTIGMFGYSLMGHDIIDMLGLTDSTVARHPQPLVEGMASTWKERKYNAGYVLGRRPDYIMFSTGGKPSAPAEKALLLYSQFQDSYRTIGWLMNAEKVGLGSGSIGQVFKKLRPVEGDIEPVYPLEFVEYYKRGLDTYSQGDQRQAIYWYDMAIKVSPKPAYIYVPYQKALSFVILKQHARAAVLMDSIVAVDSMIFMAHAQLLKYATVMGYLQKAEDHRRWLRKMVPWYLPRVEAQAAQMLRNAGRNKP